MFRIKNSGNLFGSLHSEFYTLLITHILNMHIDKKLSQTVVILK